MEYGRCRFVSVRNILQQLDGSEVTVLRNHVVHPHTAVLLRQYLCLAVKSLLLQQPPQYRESPASKKQEPFFTKLPVGTYIRLLFLIIRRIPPATRKAIPPTSRTGPDAEEESSLSTRKTEAQSHRTKKEGKNKSRNIGNLLYIGMRCGNRFRQQKCFDSYGLKILFLLIVQ